MKNYFEVKDVTFSSSKEHELVNVNFYIKDQGDIISILGPSGVGKTTILRAIAGLDKIKKGEIWLNKNIISSENIFLEPEKREIALSFQENTLFPHYNVLDNLKLGEKRKDNYNKISLDDCIEKFFLKEILNKYPHEISSGEAQRASLTRSLLSNPKLLLLDEPFSNVDIGLIRMCSSLTKHKSILRPKNVFWA